MISDQGASRTRWAAMVMSLLMVTSVVMPSASAQDSGPESETPPVRSAERSLAAFQAVGETILYEDQAGNAVFRVEDGFDLDQYLFRSDGPIDFSIDIKANFGPVDANGNPAPGNDLYDKIGRITLRVFDVDDDFVGADPPEVDQLFINGNPVSPALSGANDQWSINTLTFPLNWLQLSSEIGGTATNNFQVFVDTATTGADRWAAEVDWAELRVGVRQERPLVIMHGFTGSGDDFESLEAYYVQELPALDGRIIRPSNGPRTGMVVNAGRVEQPIADLLDRTASNNVHVLAHSKGGLDTRLYIWNNPSRVDRFVMLGTPNAGSQLADIVCGAELIGPAVAAGGFLLKLALERQFGDCGGPGDAVFELQEDWVKKIFNRQVLDRNGTTYLTIGGTGGSIFSGLLGGEDDGTVALSSLQYLDRFDPDHPGKHNALDVFNINHTELRMPDQPAAPSSICALYFSTCDTVFGARQAGINALVAAEPVAQLSGLIGVTVDPGSSVALPVVFEGTPRAEIMVVGDGVTADLEGSALTPTKVFEATVLGGSFVSPTDGTLTITNPGATAVDVAVLVTIETARDLAVSVPPSVATAGQPVELTATLTNALLSDVPEVSVRDSSGNTVAIAATKVDDQTWTGSFTPPVSGVYTVMVHVPAPGLRIATTLLSVGGSAATLTGGFSERTTDDNGNGLFDSLIVDAGVQVTAPGVYRLAARLTDGAGTTVSTAGGVADLPAGSVSVALAFDGRDIYESGISGPYEVVDVVLSREDLSLEGEQPSLGFTAAYDYRSFEHIAIEINLDGFSDQGVDSNDDGTFDELVVAGSVRVDNPGSYAINARLVASEGTEIGEFATIASLGGGDNSFSLTFPWGPVAAAGIDGPFTVQDLSIYPTASADVLGYLVLAHTTAAYNASGQQTATFASVQALIADFAASGEISDNGIANSLTSKVVNAEASYNSGQTNAAINQLGAFRNQLAAQRGKKVSETAFLALDAAAEQLIASL